MFAHVSALNSAGSLWIAATAATARSGWHSRFALPRGEHAELAFDAPGVAVRAAHGVGLLHASSEFLEFVIAGPTDVFVDRHDFVTQFAVATTTRTNAEGV